MELNIAVLIVLIRLGCTLRQDAAVQDADAEVGIPDLAPTLPIEAAHWRDRCPHCGALKNCNRRSRLSAFRRETQMFPRWDARRYAR